MNTNNYQYQAKKWTKTPKALAGGALFGVILIAVVLVIISTKGTI